MDNCISGFRDCVALVESSVAEMETSLMDHHRIQGTLKTRRVFGLVPDVDLRDAKAYFRSSVAPLVLSLVDALETEYLRIKMTQYSPVSSSNLPISKKLLHLERLRKSKQLVRQRLLTLQE